MMEYYDKQGKPMADVTAWGIKMEHPGYKRVAETTLSDGTWISTVWLGLDHNWGDGPPIIFESMAFPSKDGPFHELDMDRYATLEQAQAGHERMVARIRDAVEAAL